MSFTVITRPGCGYCDKAKDLLKRNELPYEEDVRDTPDSVEAFKAMGFKTFPQVFENGTPIGGYTELELFLNDDDF